jgi:ParB-like nuclease domain
MNYIPVIRDSIETSVSMKLFKTIDEATKAHIFKSTFTKFPMSKCKNLDNFNSERLQSTAVKAYPLTDRPRGNNDISSVKFYQKQIKEHKEIQPIWILQLKNKQYILLDGAHRIVANFIENKKYLNAYIITV